MIGCGLAGSFGQLLAWRWVTGLGSALQMAGAQLFLTDISASSNRARTLGTNQARCHTLPTHSSHSLLPL
jgi:MFS family permease